ncbi:ATP-binding protein [Streptosporangium canum]|uniref:ATP-binding protein n=1 Tax=Streptosporangium canum TaxID=324952 RepID=UPI0036901F58
MDGFIGRDHELGRLRRLLDKVEAGGRVGRPGRAILVRGRRRVGKSRLAEEFIRRSSVPHLFYSAARGPEGQQLQRFLSAGAASDLPGAQLMGGQSPDSWDAALRLLVAALPRDSPSIVVLDELPYLIASSPDLESVLQVLFDREFSHRPVLLILIGSDLSMMEAINRYDRPFYMRATEMVVRPLTPADVARKLELTAADAFDAHLVSGGLPMICEEWRPGLSVQEYLQEALTDSTSSLVISGERALAAELPPDAQARTVLSAIGSGQRTHASIDRATPGIPRASLNRALQFLVEKRLVVSELPLATRPSRETRYHIADTHLRFWLTFVGPWLPEIERDRGDLVLARFHRSWTSWRGAAVEPVVRESLRRMDGLPEGTCAIGGYWTRTNDPEIDIVGADREPVAKKITMVGSIKWLENRPFDRHDLSELIVHRAKLPGADTSTPLFAVSRSGVTAEGVEAITPERLLDAWRPLSGPRGPAPADEAGP